jgi:uncharacterized membrane protein (UPF0127 family)
VASRADGGAGIGRESWEQRLGKLEHVDLDGGLRVYEARSVNARRKGLGGLESLPADVGLRIRTGSVQTISMRFPLDLIWLGRDGRVLRIDRDVPPRRMKACLRARAVVEVPAGLADRFVNGGLGG